MSLGVLAASEPASNAVTAVAARKGAKDSTEKSSDFKNLVHHHSHGNHTDKAKTEKSAATDGAKRDESDGRDRPMWHDFGLRFDRGDAVAKIRDEDAGPDGAEATDGEKPDPTAATAEAALIVEAGIAMPAAPQAVKAADPEPDSASIGEPEGNTPSTDAKPVIGARIAAKVAPVADAGPAAVAEQAANVAAVADTKPAADSGQVADAAVPAKAGQIGAAAAESLQPAVAKSDAKQAGTATPARAPSGEAVYNATPAAVAKAATQENAANADARSGGDGQGREQQGQTPAGGGRTAGVTIISQQVAPAPVAAAQPVAMSETGTAFATALAPQVPRGEHAEAAANATLAQHAGKLTPITTLSIQLHPAELGVVTAKLSGTHAQLSIEISVNNAEARHRLTSDSDSIVTALKGMGIEVDRVTVQHTQSGSGATPNNTGRGGEFSQSGESRGERQGQSSRQGSDRNDGENQRAARRIDAADVAGGGVYI